MSDKLIFNCTYGKADPERATLPFVAANIAATQDRAVVLCTIDAVWLGTEGGAEGIARGLPVLNDLYAEFVDNGGQVWPAVPARSPVHNRGASWQGRDDRQGRKSRRDHRHGPWRSPDGVRPIGPEATMEPKVYGRDRRVWTFAGASGYDQQVYDVLADAVAYGMGREPPVQVVRLLLNALGGPAEPGIRFTSTGRIPMNRARFDNRNTVTKADRPRLFEVARVNDRLAQRAYGEEPSSTRSRSRRWRGARGLPLGTAPLREPPGAQVPLLRSVTYRVWIPIGRAEGSQPAADGRGAVGGHVARSIIPARLDKLTS
jgi:hypothetical protein